MALGSFTAFESDALSVAVGAVGTVAAVAVAVDDEVWLAPPPDEEDDEEPSILEMRWESKSGRQLPPTCPLLAESGTRLVPAAATAAVDAWSG